MLYELRIYDAVAGRLPDISGRFANHTCALFRKHGVKYLGFWTDEIGRSNRLTYINVFDSMADRESRWAKFGADPDWLAVRRQTEADGPLVDAVTNRFLRLTPYSPEPRISTAVQELRIYEAMPGRLPEVHNRFRQPHHWPVRKARHRKHWLLVRGCGREQCAGLYAGLPQPGRPGKELAFLPGRPGMAQGARGQRSGRPHRPRFPPQHYAPHRLRFYQRLAGRRAQSAAGKRPLFRPKRGLLPAWRQGPV